MYNRLYKYLKESNISYGKQFGFQSRYSTNDAIVQLVDNIFDSFVKRSVHSGSLNWFVRDICYSWSFHFAEKKLKLYGITDKNLASFETYLSNRKQYIHIGGHRTTEFKHVTYGVPQGSILGPLLFLVYVNNLPDALVY